MSGFAVAVTFRIRTERGNRFMELLRSQAAASLLEEGCLIFQIWTESSRSDEVFLWEVYSDRAAFDMHLESSHFIEFERKTADLVVAKTVLSWDSQTG